MPLDDLIKQSGLDLADFSEFSIQSSRYPKYDNQIFMVPPRARSSCEPD